MEMPLHDLIRHARVQYNAPGWSRLRKKWQVLARVRHNEHEIPIPEQLKKTGRAEPIYAGICGEKVDRGKALMTDPEGAQWDCAQIGITRKSDRDRQFMEQFISSAWDSMKEACERDPEEAVKDDNLTLGPGWIRVQPNPSVIIGVLETDRQVTQDDVETWASGQSDEEDDTLVTQAYLRMKKEKARRQAYFRSVFGVSAVYVPGSSVLPRWDNAGLAEIIELREVPVSRVLADYRKPDGSPEAAQLAEAVRARNLTDDDTVTLLIRADRDDMQVCVTTLINEVSRDANQRRYAMGGASRDEMIYSGPHELGMVPYAYFAGRESASDEPARRWRPLIEQPVVGIAMALDRLVTQRATVVRHAAWSGMVVERDIAGTPPETGTRGPRIEIPEGGIGLQLGPGEKLTRPPWVDPEATALMQQTEAQYRSDIDRATFGTAAYGTHGAGSGYELAQLQAAAESVLMPFIKSFCAGLSRVGELILRSCRWLIAHGVPSVPVRVATDEGLRYLELTEELAMIDWKFKASIIPQPLGGEYSKFQTIKAMTDYGFISFAEGQRRMGIRNGDKMQQAWLSEQLARSPKVIEQLQIAVANKSVAALNAPATGNMPQQGGFLPPALAALLQQPGMNVPPEIAARLPGGPAPMTPAMGPGGMPGMPPGVMPMNAGGPQGGVPGMPNMAAQGPGASPMGRPHQVGQAGLPTRFPDMPGMPGGPGGQQAGQASPAPGGINNMSYINGLGVNRAAA